MQKIVITGGAGYIGSHVCLALQVAGYEPVILDSLTDTRRSVLERFGLADEEHKPVGQPPITRWDYREFSVYFEYDHVINSVRQHRPRHLDTVKEQQ